MNSKFTAGIGGLALGIALIALSAGGEEAATAGKDAATVAGKPQTTCPVMDGNAINKKFYTDYKDKRVYFCCGACQRLFAKDPEKYMKKLQEAGIALEDAPVEGAASPAADEGHAGHQH